MDDGRLKVVAEPNVIAMQNTELLCIINIAIPCMQMKRISHPLVVKQLCIYRSLAPK